VCLPELTRRRGVGPRGRTLNVVEDVDLNETIKVFLLTNVVNPTPVYVSMRSGGEANNRFDFMDFIITDEPISILTLVIFFAIIADMRVEQSHAAG
jgi:hypothetical protein